MTRPRACGALLNDGCILMVRHVGPDRAYWTLPGGAVDAGETPAEAVVREMHEETGLRAQAVRLLFETAYGDDASPEYCFLMAAEDLTGMTLGHDPEEASLDPAYRLLQGVGWQLLDSMQDDPQVSSVRKALAERGTL